MQLLIIFGPPAVGKMSVGDEITRHTGMPVFHNHLSIEPVLRFFPFGHPSFEKIVSEFRLSLMGEVAKSDLPGIVYTFVWSLDDSKDSKFLMQLCKFFEDEGADIALVELKADLSKRLIRNRSEARMLEKPSKRDVEFSEEHLLGFESEHRMNSDGTVPLGYKHLVIDNNNLSANEAALEIIAKLSLVTLEH